jgi:RNA polymerase sigma factor (sigma-70 family)
MTDSHTLLSQYARTGSESAFRKLVSRYIDLVYSTAFRLVDGDVESAQDVTQTVFVALADQARTLPNDVMLGGWLHLRTRFAAGKLMRTERRRQLRERQAAEMNATEDHSESNLAQVAPVLDEAIGQLDAEDRTVILLRFFERKDFRGVGEALGSSEDAARKRVDRALEKLYVLLKHRGATLSAAALGTALATEAVTAAPAGLAGSVAGAALASAAAGGFGVGVLKFLALTKAELLVVASVTALAAGWLFLPRLTSSGPANTARALPAKASAFVPFSVQGTLTYEVTGYPVLHRHFTVGVSNGLWHITMILEGKTGFRSFEYHYDGTNNLQYALFENSGPDVGSGSIETGPVPSSNASDEGEIVWLAYASGVYFHALKGGTATSLERLRRGSLTRRYEVPAEWILAREEPFLPSELTQLSILGGVLEKVREHRAQIS